MREEVLHHRRFPRSPGSNIPDGHDGYVDVMHTEDPAVIRRVAQPNTDTVEV
jgi:hypothetical protein